MLCTRACTHLSRNTCGGGAGGAGVEGFGRWIIGPRVDVICRGRCHQTHTNNQSLAPKITISRACRIQATRSWAGGRHRPRVQPRRRAQWPARESAARAFVLRLSPSQVRKKVLSRGGQWRRWACGQLRAASTPTIALARKHAGSVQNRGCPVMADNARVAHGRQARVCTSFHGAVRASTSRPPRGSARADPRAIECALPYLAVNDTTQP